jgi:hypothetical protein
MLWTVDAADVANAADARNPQSAIRNPQSAPAIRNPLPQFAIPLSTTTRQSAIGNRQLAIGTMDSAIAFLTAMITPAVLISACGSMILSTSARLGRVVDRVRALSDRLEEMAGNPNFDPDLRERQSVIFEQLDKLTSRARILQRSMVTFYLGLGMFVTTSVAIGIVALAGRYTVLPVVLGLTGAVFLCYGSVLLIFEARLALSTIHLEMDFIWRQSKRVAPAEIVEQHKPHFVHFRKPRMRDR